MAIKTKIKINLPLKHYKKGDIVNIEIDINGLAIDRYWRNRIKDSKIDGCVEYVKSNPRDKSVEIAKNKDDNNKKHNKKTGSKLK